MPLKPVEGNGDVCIRLGKAEVLVGLSIGNQRVFVHSFLAGSVFAVSKMGGARDETIFFDFQGLGSALGAPTSPSAPGDADVSSASEGGKCETTFCETTFRLFRCVSIRHADGDVGIPQGADETSASPDADETSAFPDADETSAFPEVPTRRRRSRGNRRIRQRFGRIRHSVVATSGHGGKSS